MADESKNLTVEVHLWDLPTQVFHWVLSATAGFAVFASLSVLSFADEGDHDRARAALKAGEIVSLNLMLSKVENMFYGSILEVELEEENAESWGGDGETTGEHADKDKNTLPGITPIDGSDDGSVDDVAVPLAVEAEPPSNSGGRYVEGEGAVAGNKARGGTIFIYKIKLLSPQGNVLRIEFNAKSMEILGVSGRDPESARKKR